MNRREATKKIGIIAAGAGMLFKFLSSLNLSLSSWRDVPLEQAVEEDIIWISYRDPETKEWSEPVLLEDAI